jgi:hypothetical protein
VDKVLGKGKAQNTDNIHHLYFIGSREKKRDVFKF